MQAAVAAYAEHINQENREQQAQVEADRRALDKIERAIAGIMTAIEDGLHQPTMKARMAELERQKTEIAARMALAPQVVRRSIPVSRKSTGANWSGSPKRLKTRKPGSTPPMPFVRSFTGLSCTPAKSGANSMPRYMAR